MAALDGLFSLYFDGDLDASFAFGGQVAGRIDAVKPVAQIIDETIAEFHDTLQTLAAAVRMSALDGLRVLEASEGVATSYAGKLLRDQGADVVKLEPPEGGALRRWSAATPDAPIEETGALFAFLDGARRASP